MVSRIIKTIGREPTAAAGDTRSYLRKGAAKVTEEGAG